MIKQANILEQLAIFSKILKGVNQRLRGKYFARKTKVKTYHETIPFGSSDT
jgi:hypothetical protein